MVPQIVSVDAGLHNFDIDKSVKRLNLAGSYKDLSTIIITPGFGSMPTKCVASWLSMMTPPNGKICRMFPINMEIGEAYSQTIQNILDHPDLSKWKYVLTIEHDNAPPCDGLVRLLKHMEVHPEFDAIGGLYWCKGPDGPPQIWGDPSLQT